MQVELKASYPSRLDLLDDLWLEEGNVWSRSIDKNDMAWNLIQLSNVTSKNMPTFKIMLLQYPYIYVCIYIVSITHKILSAYWIF